MSNERSPTLRLRARGEFACFTRPEMKAERVSYPVMTPSAARGLIEAVVWKPAIAWHIERIHVLKEPRFITLKRNEVNSKASAPSAKTVENGGAHKQYFAEEDRAQRNTMALRDVDYVIEAHFTMTSHAGESDNVNKFIDIFRRRVKKGQHFHQPYLGCREFPAHITPADDAPKAIPLDKELGIMLWDISFGTKKKKPDNRPIFFEAELKDGVMEIPIDAEAAEATLLSGAKGGAS